MNIHYAKIKRRLVFSISIICLSVFVLVGFGTPQGDFFRTMIGSVFSETITPEDTQKAYDDNNFRILIVPGHDTQYRGAEHNEIVEAELNLLMAEKLYEHLSNNTHFKIYLTREFGTGLYTAGIGNYLNNNREEIGVFRSKARSVLSALISKNLFEEKQSYHNYATSEMSLRLYGINKWANENKIDLVLHIHFNDYPHRTGQAGIYNGFAVFVPDSQYPNSRVGKALGEAVRDELAKFSATSDMPQEIGGLVESQDLIAVGSNASRDGASILVEYGFIYEPQFRREGVRDLVLGELARRTFDGLNKYFEDEVYKDESVLFGSFNNRMQRGMKGNADVLRLQAFLTEEGFYPPTGKTFNLCPINGNFGSCVETAVKDFQNYYVDEILTPFGISSGTGVVGDSTLKKINETVVD